MIKGGKIVVFILFICGVTALFFVSRQTASDQYFWVEKVIDGDTFVIRENGRVTKVRLIGVDTPETVDPRRPVQCYGPEASAYLKKILTNQRVRLVRDVLGDDRDKYDRLLRYVFVAGANQSATNTFINLDLLEKGYAFAYPRFPFDLREQFIAAERGAHRAGLGLWATSTCDGKH